jgi:hypothetical protein
MRVMTVASFLVHQRTLDRSLEFSFTRQCRFNYRNQLPGSVGFPRLLVIGHPSDHIFSFVFNVVNVCYIIAR